MKVEIKVTIPPRLLASVRGTVRKATKKALNVAAHFVRDKLSEEADSKLSSEQAYEYKRGLQEPNSIEVGDEWAIVRLVGALPVAIEKGFPSFSIKEKMLASAAALGKGFVDVPFDHKSKSVPRGIIKDLGDMARASKDALATVRRKAVTPGKTITKTLHPSGEQLTTTHKRGIYDDIMRIPYKSGKKIKGKYLTIRRISKNSDPSSWIHPGFPGIKIIDSVMSRINLDITKLINDVVADTLATPFSD